MGKAQRTFKFAAGLMIAIMLMGSAIIHAAANETLQPTSEEAQAEPSTPPSYATVTVKNTTIGLKSNPEDEFMFVFTSDSDAKLTLVKNGVPNYEEFVHSKAFKLSNKDYVDIYGLKDGVDYLIEQAPDESYSTKVNGSNSLRYEAKAKDGANEVAFINEYHEKPKAVGGLSIEKKVASKTAEDLNRSFEIKITIEAPGKFSYNGSKSGQIASGESVLLKNGEKILIAGIPESTEYTVVETAVPDSATFINGAQLPAASGTIVAGADTELLFESTFGEAETEYKPLTAIMSGFVYLNTKAPKDGLFTVTVTAPGIDLPILEATNIGKYITFEPMTFDKPGIYHFDMKQLGTNPDYILDDVVYTVEIDVKSSDAGKLSAIGRYLDKDGNRIDGVPVFNNSTVEENSPTTGDRSNLTLWATVSLTAIAAAALAFRKAFAR